MTRTYNDYPIFECIEAAEDLIAKGADIYQKWTCQHCRSRQTMAVKNTFYKSGICEECKNVTVISACNYLVHMTPKQRP